MATKKDKSGYAGVHIKNKKAYHNYEFIEKVEAGIVLRGTEVKSLRMGLCELDGAYGRIKGNAIWLVGCKIAQYPQANRDNHDPTRDRKLLLHATQIRKLRIKLDQRGFTLVPVRMYFNARGLAKVELALARGKRQYDKRQKLVQQQQKRDVARSMKNYRG